eukprot:752311-Hanusia_phi.AAC.3
MKARACARRHQHGSCRQQSVRKLSGAKPKCETRIAAQGRSDSSREAGNTERGIYPTKRCAVVIGFKQIVRKRSWRCCWRRLENWTMPSTQWARQTAAASRVRGHHGRDLKSFALSGSSASALQPYSHHQIDHCALTAMNLDLGAG